MVTSEGAVNVKTPSWEEHPLGLKIPSPSWIISALVLIGWHDEILHVHKQEDKQWAGNREGG